MRFYLLILNLLFAKKINNFSNIILTTIILFCIWFINPFTYCYIYKISGIFISRYMNTLNNF